MSFRKTGDVPIEYVKCACGASVKGHTGNCPKCGKPLLPVKADKEEKEEDTD